MKPQIYIDQFTYDLHESRIAKYPVENRDQSKLLVYKDKQISDNIFSEIVDQIPSNALIVFNNTKVIRARLEFKKSTGARIEIFCLEPVWPTDVQESFATNLHTTWRCIVGNLKKWKSGMLMQHLTVNGHELTFTADRITGETDVHLIDFKWDNRQVSFGEIIESFGTTPIPPYLNRTCEDIDTERYQTVYSRHKGSVAAPTAGLHFTDMILEKLVNKGVKTTNVTLHVGAGTFKPVKSTTIDGHDMHVENFYITEQTLTMLIAHQGPLVAVGTTTVRTLESLYWLGVKLKNGHTDYFVGQWDPYQLQSTLTYKQSLQILVDEIKKHNLQQLNAQTAIMIAPGYTFMSIDILVTNFHQPQSTLLLLIGALIGDEWKHVYQHAIDSGYRFLSYGDSSILFKG